MGDIGRKSWDSTTLQQLGKMKIYYRFSFRLNPDHNGNPRTPPDRPEWFDKWKCLANFTNVFSQHDITIQAENVDDQVWEKLNNLYPNLDLRRTSHGTSGWAYLSSLKEVLEMNLDPNTIVYFVEDDYVHHEGSDIILEQGLGLCQYVSLYDHPDKYWGENFSRPSLIFMSPDVHWRTVPSTTLTFASRISTLIEDRDIFYKWCDSHGWMHDNQLFTELTTNKLLITPVPGYATHCDTWVIGKMVDWQAVLTRTT